jgi:hypothetical protein
VEFAGYAALINPRYAGLKTHNGKVIGQGKWTLLIDVKTHEGLEATTSSTARSSAGDRLDGRRWIVGVCLR